MSAELKYKLDEELFELFTSDKATARAAFDEIYSRYSNKIYTYCKKILNDSQKAEDVFQDTFTKFYESAGDGRKMTNVSGFLVKIARNLCLNEKAKKSSQNVSIDDFQFAFDDKSYEKKEINNIINMGLDALPEKYREALILKEFLDMSYQDIAEALGTTLPIIRIRIYRAKAKLREILAPYFEEYEK